MNQPELIIVTGPREAGKTTFCHRLIDESRRANQRIGGILCPPVFENGKKIAIDAQNLKTGEQRQLATLRTDRSSPRGPLTTRWRFDAAVLAWGNEVLQTATPCDLLIVDELGPLEFEQNTGWVAGLAALDAGQFRHGMVVIRPELLETARRRWPAARVIEIPPR